MSKNETGIEQIEKKMKTGCKQVYKIIDIIVRYYKLYKKYENSMIQ